MRQCEIRAQKAKVDKTKDANYGEDHLEAYVS